MTNAAYMTSLIQFLIQDVSEDTKENAVELYNRWRKISNIRVVDPRQTAWTLEYLNSMKHRSKAQIIKAAKISGYIV